MHNTTDLNHSNLLPRMMQEMSVFAFIPLNILANIDANSMSTMITAALGGVVSIFAIRFYNANTKKINVEREVLELERENLKKLKRKSKKDDGDD